MTASVRTNDLGEFESVGLHPGTYRVRVQRADRVYCVVPAGTLVVRPGDREVRVIRLADTRIVGRIVSSASREPVLWSRVQVVAIPSAAEPDTDPLAVFLDADSRFVIEGLPPGKWEIRVSPRTSGTPVRTKSIDVPSAGVMPDLVIEF